MSSYFKHQVCQLNEMRGDCRNKTIESTEENNQNE